MSISLKNLYFHSEYCTEKVTEGQFFRITASNPCGKLPENYFEWPEAKIVADYWTDECTKILENLVKKFGEKAEYKLNLEKILGEEKYKELLNKLQKAKEHYEPLRMWIHGFSTPPSYFAEALISTLKLPIPEFKKRLCRFCHRSFTPGVGDETPWDYDFLSDEFSYQNMPFCSKCLKKAFGWPRPKPKSKSAALKFLSNFYNILGFIPPYNYLNKDFLHRLEVKELKNIMKIMQELPDPDFYKKRFRSWFRALIAAGIISTGARKMSRGTMLLAKDGHMCFSMGEKSIDDWLKKNRIKHEKEAHYPKDGNLNPNGFWRADWKINKIYIEYAGLKGEKSYDDKMLLKEELATKKQLDLIILTSNDLGNLANKLNFLKSN